PSPTPSLPERYTLSLHDALPILTLACAPVSRTWPAVHPVVRPTFSTIIPELGSWCPPGKSTCSSELIAAAGHTSVRPEQSPANTSPTAGWSSPHGPTSSDALSLITALDEDGVAIAQSALFCSSHFSDTKRFSSANASSGAPPPSAGPGWTIASPESPAFELAKT